MVYTIFNNIYYSITMNTISFRKAERKQAKLRIGITGVAGSGKTMSALRLAYGITKNWNKIFFIDTENGSGELYAKITGKDPSGDKYEIGEYNYMRLDAPYTPERYVEAMKAAEEAGAEIIIIDSTSHEWDGRGGILEESNKGSFAIWNKLTPRHNRFIEAITNSKAHIITCLRRKQDYAMEQGNDGKTKVVKKGLKEIQREGFEYEVTLNLEVDVSHKAVSTKDRTGLFVERPDFLITEKTGEELLLWANEGKSQIDQDKELRIRFEELLKLKVKSKEDKDKFNAHILKAYEVKDTKDLDITAINDLIEILKQK